MDSDVTFSALIEILFRRPNELHYSTQCSRILYTYLLGYLTAKLIDQLGNLTAKLIDQLGNLTAKLI